MSQSSRFLFVAACLIASACEGPSSDDEAGDDAADDAGEPALGDTPLPSCEAAMFSFEQLAAELALPEPDLDYVIELYRGQPPDLSGESPTPGGTALQRWVREVGARLGRVEAGLLIDDAAIEAALDLAADQTGDARKLALLDVLAVLRDVALLDVRSRLAEVADALPDPARDPSLSHAQWDQAWCVWDGVIGPIARSVDAEGSEAWETRIVDAFTTGSDGISGPEQPWAADEFATKPAKQIVEKSSFGVVARALVARAQQARDQGDALAAREAAGLFVLLEDRIAGRNTPAIELIQTMLAGPTDAIDPVVIRRALAIAFVKRARKYCDEALLSDALGSADAVKGVEEGDTYTRIILPDMDELLADQGFVGSDYLARWSDYREAVLADDPSAATEASTELIEWNCAMQDALGIAACTDSADEP
ncbi:hypothetical protein ACNOYE_18185 [Nannocystaceae bacterium ST9]